MITAPIINESQVKSLANIDNNISDLTVANTVILAQVEYFERPLGTDLAQHLIDEEALANLTPDEQVVWDYLTQAVAYATAEKLCVRLQYRLAAGGVSKHIDTEYKEPVDGDELRSIRSFYRDSAAEYLQAALQHIKDNDDAFPLYEKNLTYDVESVNTQSGGLFFPKKNYDNY